MIAAAILACEVTFWAALIAGLTARYRLGRDRLSTGLLVCVPLSDLVLLVLTGADLARGAHADWTHGLAAVYLGFGVVFGQSVVDAADRRFAVGHGAMQAPPPGPDPGDAAAHMRLWLRCLAACAIASVVLGALILVAGDPARTRELWAGGGWFAQLGALCLAWLALGPGWTVAAHRVGQISSREKEPT
jgi:hypothetical protein